MKTIVCGMLLLLAGAGAAEAQSAIYRCSTDNGTVYSDRPCGAGAERHEIDASRVTVYTPAPTSQPRAAAAKQPKAKRSKSGSAIDPAQQRLKCARLDQGLRDVRNKMRSGYGVEEGERLKARQQRLGEQRRTQKCSQV